MSERGYLATLRVRLTAEISSLREQLASADGLIKAFVVGAAAVLLALGGSALAAADQIDDALDSIRISTGATGDALASLEGSFDTVFASVPNDSAQVARAIGEIHRRTGQTGEGLEQLSAQVLTLSRITGTDLKANVAATTRLFGDWGIATGEQSAALDLLFRASQATGVEVGTLAEQLVRYGAPLRALGFGFSESAAMLAQFEQAGVNAQLVLGSLRIALGNFAKAGKDAPAALREVVARIEELGPGAEATALALKTFGARAGPDMAAAILEGRLSIDALVERITSGTETIQGAAAETDGWREALARLRNVAVMALEPFATPALRTFNAALVAVLENADAVRDGLYRVGQAATVVAAVLVGRLVPAFARTTAAAIATAAAYLRNASAAGILAAASGALRTALIWFGGPWGVAAAAVLAVVGVAFLETGRRARQAAAEAKQAAADFASSLAGMSLAGKEFAYTSALDTRVGIEGQVRNIQGYIATFEDRIAAFRPGMAVEAKRAFPEFREMEAGLAQNRRALATLLPMQDLWRQNSEAAWRAVTDERMAVQGLTADLNHLGNTGGDAGGESAGAARRAVEVLRDRVGLLLEVYEIEQAQGRSTAGLLERLNGAYGEAAARLRAMGDAARLSPAALEDYRDLAALVARLRAEGLNELGAAPLRDTSALRAAAPVLDLGAAGAQVAAANTRGVAAFVAQNALRIKSALREGADEAARRLEQASENLRGTFRGLRDQLVGALPQQVGEFIRVFRDVRAARETATRENVPLRGEAAIPPAAAAAGMLVLGQVLAGFAAEAGPALSAFLLPLKLFGELLAVLVVPVLRLLYPPLRLVVHALSYLVTGIGYAVRTIGQLVDALPFVSGGPIIRAGQAMIDGAEALRDRLRDMDFDDALAAVTDASDRAARAVLNMVEGFRVSRYRFAASEPEDRGTRAATPAPAGPAAPAVPNVTYSGSTSISIQTSGDGAETYRAFYAEVRRLARSNPAMRAWVETLAVPT